MAQIIDSTLNRLASDEGFKNKTILISGGTGFLGKVLVEKILRTCHLVKRIYLMIRVKRGKNPQDRLKEMFSNPLYDLLKKTRGDDIIKKVVVIPSNLTEVDMGLSGDARQTLIREVEIIFHNAAAVRFDEKLKYAVFLNVRGTKLMLELAKECRKLLVFSHISTAYCHLNEKVLHEKAYPPPRNPHDVINIIEWMDDDLCETFKKQLLKHSPNTYCFTKALAECLVAEQMENLPVIILRPSVVIPIWVDPLPGWNDNINGPVGLLIGAGKGIIRTMYCDSNSYADFLPVDIAVNAFMLATFDYMFTKSPERRVYNCTSSFQYKITWFDIIELGKKVVCTKIPLNGVVWYPGGSLKRSRLLNKICVVLFQYVPAIILDAIIYLSGNKPILWRIQQRISKGCEVFEYFANNTWEFNNDRSLAARYSVFTECERKLYKVDGDNLNMEEYFYNCIMGARRYVLKETDDTIPDARQHMNRMWLLDRFCRVLMLVGFSYFIMQYIVFPLMGP